MSMALVCVALVLGAAGSMWLSMRWAQVSALDSLQRASAHRASLHATSLSDHLRRYALVPFMVASDLRTREVFLAVQPSEASITRLNQHLESLAKASGALDLYVMDARGTTLAASNWADPKSFVGKNFEFRPYFRDAMIGQEGRFYGIGTTSNRPGYYVSYPIMIDQAIRGVAVIKVDLETLEPNWASSDTVTVVADRNGVIFLTSIPKLRYNTLGPLPPSARSSIDAARQYEGATFRTLSIDPLPLVWDEAKMVRTNLSPEGKHLMLNFGSGPLPHDWRLVMFVDAASIESQSRSAALAGGLGFAVLVLSALFWIQRRRRTREQVVAKRALERAHHELEIKVEERTAELLSTQDELVQAGKLALLGQLSASVAHEINQPLAALRTFSDNSLKLLRLGRVDELSDNLDWICKLTDRVGSITAQLKNFSRRTPPVIEAVDVCVAIENSLMLTSERMRLEGIAVQWQPQGKPLLAYCELIRLEQVLVNLLCNAADAVSGRSERQVEVVCRADGVEVSVEVGDSGRGIPGHIRERLFEPFVSSKASGLGLGLTISYAVVQVWSGRLEARNRTGGGSCFSVHLRSVEKVI
jgi:two-component system C4-dicarboxylate transport sensor histidine kinase DctB